VIATLLRDPALAPILAALPHARVVGGAVRDALLGRPIADIDLATPDPPDATQAALERAGLRVIPTGLAHGTVTALSDHRPFEITTLRRDVATDGRHAEVAWTTDWQADAARRDFTINAMSLDRAGVVHDYFGGQADLAAARVRFVGDPATRIAEDYLRVLRYFRFFARYGANTPDADTAGALRAAIPGLAGLSAERVWSELKKILAAPNPLPAINLMAELSILQAILPEAANRTRLVTLIAAGAPPDPLLRLAALLTGSPELLAARLNLSNAEASRLATLASGPILTPDAPDITLRRRLAEEDADTLIARSYLQATPDPSWDRLRTRLQTVPRPIFPLEGRHALAMGATPGPAIGQALRQTREAWLADGCTADTESLLETLRERLHAANALTK